MEVPALLLGHLVPLGLSHPPFWVSLRSTKWYLWIQGILERVPLIFAAVFFKAGGYGNFIFSLFFNCNFFLNIKLLYSPLLFYYKRKIECFWFCKSKIMREGYFLFLTACILSKPFFIPSVIA